MSSSGKAQTAFAFGTAAAMPAASGANKNTSYYATDTGRVTFSDGAAWHDIGFVNATTLGSLRVGTGANSDMLLESSGHLSTVGSASLTIDGGINARVSTIGNGLLVAEGANAKQGVATLVAGTVVVANTSVTASSRIFLTAQDNNTTGHLRVSARTAGTSFTILSTVNTDTGVIAYEIFEPA